MKTRTLAASFTFLFATHPSAMAAERSLNLRAITMAGGFSGTEIFAHSPGDAKEGTKVVVKSFLNHESNAVPVKTETLVFTAEAEPSTATNKSAVIGEIKVPDGFVSGILVFLPGPKEGKPTVSLFDDDRKAFPPGATRVINSTKTDLRLEIEGRKFDVKAGGSLIIQDQPVGSNNSSSVKAFAGSGADWTQFSAAMWPHPGQKRVLQIATENPQTGKMELRGVRDISTPH